MNDYKLNLDIEPKDDYEKAKKDLSTFFVSLKKLSHQDQIRLAREFFGDEYVNAVMHIWRLFFY